VRQGSVNDFQSELENQNAWYLVDGKVPQVSEGAITVLVTSPNVDIWGSFSKRPTVTIRYMPIWTWEEISKLWSKKYSTTLPDINQVLYLFYHWGGVPRYVLEKAKDKSQQLLLDQTIAACDLTKISQSIGQVGAKEGTSHRILHIIPADDYVRTQIHFASEYVANQVVTKYETKNRGDLIMFLKSASSLGEIASLRGQLFESYAHEILQHGGKFQIRDLQQPNNPPQEISLTPTSEVLIRSVNDLPSLQPNNYGRPIARTWTSIDSLIWIPSSSQCYLFQITVSPSHPVKLKGLNDVSNKLNNTSTFLFFAVPPDIFQTFKYQSYHQNNQVAKVLPIVKTDQYAIEIPFK